MHKPSISSQGYKKKTHNKSRVQCSDFKTNSIYPRTNRNAVSSPHIHECAPIPVVGKASLFRHVHPSPKHISVQPMTYWIFPNSRTSMFEDPKMNLFDPRKVRLHCHLFPRCSNISFTVQIEMSSHSSKLGSPTPRRARLPVLFTDWNRSVTIARLRVKFLNEFQDSSQKRTNLT